MSHWSDRFFTKVIGRIYVKKKAHAFTVLSAMWTIFSLLAFLVCKDSGDLIAWIASSLVWLLHLAFVCCALWFFRHERKDTEVLIHESID